MDILLVGINYRTAPVDLRECFTVADHALEMSLTQLKEVSGCLEAVLLSTCNRTEIYAVVEDVVQGERGIRRFLSSIASLDEADFASHLYLHEGIGAIRQMLRVVTGMDSMIVGETQILGQFKHAFLFAQEHGSTGTWLNPLLNRVIAFGKRVQAETSIGQNAVSVSYAAVALAKKVFDQLQSKSVLVIGAGKMSELTLTNLAAHGVRDVTVVNRTFERAERVARKYGGRALTFAELRHALAAADIVIASTGAKEWVLDAEQVHEAMKRRRMRPMFLIDIAVPRDIDPAAAKLSDVYLYDIDDLQEVVSANVALRKQEAERVEVWMDEEIAAVRSWLREQEAVPLIAALRRRSQEIQDGVLQSLFNKLPGLDEHDRKVVQKHLQSVANQILRSPTVKLKSLSAEAEGALHLQTFARLFDLDAPLSSDRETRTHTDEESERSRQAARQEESGKQALSWRESRSPHPLAAL